MTTRVVNCKKEHFDVYIGRYHPKYGTSKWRNPFKIGKDGTREEVIIKYRKWLLLNPELLKQLPELRGKTLGCWCVDKPIDYIRNQKECHGEVILEELERQL